MTPASINNRNNSPARSPAAWSALAGVSQVVGCVAGQQPQPNDGMPSRTSMTGHVGIAPFCSWQDGERS